MTPYYLIVVVRGILVVVVWGISGVVVGQSWRGTSSARMDKGWSPVEVLGLRYHVTLLGVGPESPKSKSRRPVVEEVRRFEIVEV